MGRRERATPLLVGKVDSTTREVAFAPDCTTWITIPEEFPLPEVGDIVEVIPPQVVSVCTTEQPRKCLMELALKVVDLGAEFTNAVSISPEGADRATISCKLGLWKVTGRFVTTEEQQALAQEAWHYWIQYYRDGEYEEVGDKKGEEGNP